MGKTSSRATTKQRLGGLLENLEGQAAGAFPTITPQELANQAAPKKKRRYIQVQLVQIRPNPFQPREDFTDEAELLELGESIKEHGLQEPLIVRAADIVGMFDLAAGERRWRAMKLVGLTEADAIEILECSDEELETIGLIENIHRKDLSRYELAKAYWKLHRKPDGSIRRSIAEVAKQVNRTVDHVDSHLAIIRAPEKLRQLSIEDPRIPLRTIRDLSQIEDENDLAYLIEEVRTHTYTANEISNMLQRVKKAQMRSEQQTEIPEQGIDPTRQEEESVEPLENTPSSQGISSTTDMRVEANQVIPAGNNGHSVQSPVISMQSKSEESERAAEENKALVKEVPGLSQKPTPSPVVALAALETKLKRDGVTLRKIVDPLAEEIPFMTPDQRRAVKTQMQTWLVLLQQIVEQTRED